MKAFTFLALVFSLATPLLVQADPNPYLKEGEEEVSAARIDPKGFTALAKAQLSRTSNKQATWETIHEILSIKQNISMEEEAQAYVDVWTKVLYPFNPKAAANPNYLKHYRYQLKNISILPATSWAQKYPGQNTATTFDTVIYKQYPALAPKEAPTPVLETSTIEAETNATPTVNHESSLPSK